MLLAQGAVADFGDPAEFPFGLLRCAQPQAGDRQVIYRGQRVGVLLTQRAGSDLHHFGLVRSACAYLPCTFQSRARSLITSRTRGSFSQPAAKIEERGKSLIDQGMLALFVVQ